jgi:hypothetical protein
MSDKPVTNEVLDNKIDNVQKTLEELHSTLISHNGRLRKMEEWQIMAMTTFANLKWLIVILIIPVALVCLQYGLSFISNSSQAQVVVQK